MSKVIPKAEASPTRATSGGSHDGRRGHRADEAGGLMTCELGKMIPRGPLLLLQGSRVSPSTPPLGHRRISWGCPRNLLPRFLPQRGAANLFPDTEQLLAEKAASDADGPSVTLLCVPRGL